MDTATLVWDGKEYELKYTFGIIRRIRSEGVSIPKVFRAVMADASAAADYGDDIAYVIAWLLREAGCQGVTDEIIWRRCLSDADLRKQCFGLFMWVSTQHFTQSENIPKLQARKEPERTST